MRVVLHAIFILIYLSIYLDQYNAQQVKKHVYAVEFKIVTSTQYTDRYHWPVSGGRKQYVYITCLEVFKPVVYPKNTKYNGICIYKCQIPKMPLAKQLQNSQIDLDSLETLQFTDTLMDSPLPSDFTAGLQITALELSNPTNFQPNPEFFTSISKLRELTFEKMEVPTLPPSDLLRLESLILKNSSVKSWDNCEHIQHLEIVGLNKEQIPKEWPVNCSQLKTLKLELMTLETVHHIMDSMKEDSIMNLEKLSIQNCSLVQLPLKLMKSTSLSYIDFSNNKFLDKAILQFPPMEDLKVLSLSNNREIHSRDLIELLKRTPKLVELRLDGIGIYIRPMDWDIRQALTKLTSLEILYLNRISKPEDVFMHNHYANLSYLSMKVENPYYSIDHLKLHDFPSTGAQQLEVDLGRVPVVFVSIGPKFVENFESIYGERRSRFWLTNKGYKLIMHVGSVDCDCKNDVLWRALREFPHFLAMPNLKCSHGGLFKDEPLENLSCRKATVNGCLRRMSRESNYTTIVDCSNNPEKFRWPRPRGFRKLIAAGNHISSLYKAYLPQSLKWLDLRNNSISRLDGEQASRIFGQGRKVWLAGNQIICDCDNWPLLDALHINQSWVMDYDILTCADSGQLLRLVSVAELCRPRSVIPLIAVSALALLVLFAALLVRHNWSTLKMILYAHGFCVSCIREKDVDEDRPYDAFISFAHGDNQYVIEQLLPQLEGKPNYYRLCIHYRDWAVGEWIPAQIMKSVQLSKRTIIVLSKNFVESCWGMMEFRHANAGAMANGCQRLIVLVLDDVLSETFTPELRGYLELNTYLKCNDPWFWEKLLYAMPHKDEKNSKLRTHFENTSKSRANAFAQYIPQLEEGVVSMTIEEPTDSYEDVNVSDVPTDLDNVSS